MARDLTMIQKKGLATVQADDQNTRDIADYNKITLLNLNDVRFQANRQGIKNKERETIHDNNGVWKTSLESDGSKNSQ
jgi:hypothetical protein